MKNSTLIIAEAGVNHNGSFDLAMQLVDVAVQAGADIVKFQTFVPELTVIAEASQAEYQKQNIGKTTSQLQMLSELTLTLEEHQKLALYCRQQGIEYLSTAFDLASLEQLLEIGVQRLKIPSGEITHWPLLVASAQTGLPIILSTGMSNLDEVKAAHKLLIESGAKPSDVTVLHCNTQYPTPFEDVNLRAMNAMGEALGSAFGYSDHTLGVLASVAAVARGAQVIEKHFTLDRTLAGPDHKASLDPDQLTSLVQEIRQTELMLGTEQKAITPSESVNVHVARKYLVAKTVIRQGECFTSENLIAKRIGQQGVSPMLWPKVIGQVAKRDFHVDDILTLADLDGDVC